MEPGEGVIPNGCNETGYEVRRGIDLGDDIRELSDSIDPFLTSNQSVLDTTPKDMLVSLRSSLHADMYTNVG